MFWAADKRQTPSTPAPPRPHLCLSLLPRKSNLLLVIRCNQLCFMAFNKKKKQGWKKAKINRREGEKKTCERGTSLLIKPRAPEFWWSCAGAANIQHLFFWLPVINLLQCASDSHQEPFSAWRPSLNTPFHSAHMKMSVIVPVRLPLL